MCTTKGKNENKTKTKQPQKNLQNQLNPTQHTKLRHPRVHIDINLAET